MFAVKPFRTCVAIGVLSLRLAAKNREWVLASRGGNAKNMQVNSGEALPAALT